MIHSDMLYRLDISSLYFYKPFSDFRPVEIYKNLGFPLFTFAFTISSHACNNFYKYIYLFHILYSIKSSFLLQYMFMVYYVQT